MIPSLFIAASGRQVCAVQRLQQSIRSAAPSVQIFDWTEMKQPCPVTSPLLRRREDSDALGSQFFSFCSDACKSADLVVCYGHVGQEIGIQAGMAYALGTPVLGIRDQQEVPGPMMAGCVTRWADGEDVVPGLVAQLAGCWQDIESFVPLGKCLRCNLRDICQFYNL